MLIDITESSRVFSFKEIKGGNTHVKAQRTTTHHRTGPDGLPAPETNPAVAAAGIPLRDNSKVLGP